MKTLNVILLILLALLQFRLWNGHGSLPDVRRLEDIKQVQQQENEKLQERNQSLAAEVLDLKQGLTAVEERARSEMGMVMPDETFFQIVNVPDSAKAGSKADR
ncbi:MAG TPA: cell division protein FtsB [Gammaproteobacteria bacterium]|nr:cell division protein FtsB [Gammaproteobacteria bacterium]